MKLQIAEARALMEGLMLALDHTPSEAAVIADHLLDCELRGLGYAGLARALVITDYVRKLGLERGPMTLLRETPVSAQWDAQNTVGYLVAAEATRVAIDKARRQGVGVVGASRTYYTGMFSYYLERVTAAGFVGLVMGSGTQVVAPHGGTEPQFCTNPIAFGFPSEGVPVIWDIGTSTSTHAEVLLAQRLNRPLPEGVGFDAGGRPTTDPFAVLPGGAITAWGGHRGSGLAMSIQMMSMMAGQVNAVAGDGPMDCGFFLTVWDPAMFGDPAVFRQAISAYATQIEATRPLDPARPVRVPFARSAAVRAERLAAGWIEVPDPVVETARGIVEAA
jgi:Malate/L-lactate dehydrogenases